MTGEMMLKAMKHYLLNIFLVIKMSSEAIWELKEILASKITQLVMVTPLHVVNYPH